MRTPLLILLVVALLVPLSFIAAPYPQELLLQHLPTTAALIGLALVIWQFGISSLSYYCLLAFLILHIIGARWIYSFVPYDAVVSYFTGTSLSEAFGWQRNHYDRLVHFASGVLGVPPASEMLQRFGNMHPRGAAITSVATVLAIGAIYEVLEWQVAVLLSPEHAEAYNGQQGDVWDPQKDLALAWLGALIAMVFVFRRKPIVAASVSRLREIHPPAESA